MAYLRIVALFVLLNGVNISNGASPVDPNANKETKCLFEHLYNLSHSSTKFIFGHHHDNFEGQNFKDVGGKQNESDIKFDFNFYPGFIEYNIKVLLDGQNFSNHILSAISNGLMVGWHWEADNPVTGGNDKDTSGNPVVNLMPGKIGNANWTKSLDAFATFVKSIKLSNGHQIPMLMRPFHEMLGSFFWWGQDYCTAEQYKSAYNYTRWYLVEQHDLHNLLFVFAPNKPYRYYGNDYMEYINDRYPGNDVIDIVGFDCYDADDFHVELMNNVELVVEVSKNVDKIAAITEFGVKDGLQTTAIEDWYMSAFYDPLMSNDSTTQIAYAMTWADSSNASFWVPLQNQKWFDGFKSMYEKENTIFQNNIPDFYNDC